MIFKHFKTSLLGLILALQASLALGQNLSDSPNPAIGLTFEGEITYIDQGHNRIVVGDQTCSLKNIVQINEQQRLSEQAYRKLSAGARVSVTVNGKDKLGHPVIVAIRTLETP